MSGAVAAFVLLGSVGRASAAPSEGSVEPVRLEVQICPTEAAAGAAASAYAERVGGWVVVTLGGRSMEPLIRGRVYVVVLSDPYDSIRLRDVLFYFGRLDPSRPDRTRLLHRAVLHDRYGWLMSGDNNRWSESWDRVTPQNYLGRVVKIFQPDYPVARRAARR